MSSGAPSSNSSTQLSQKEKSGCLECRFRKKKCKPRPVGRCGDCHKFNLVCSGQGIDKPSGRELAKAVRNTAKHWIANRANRAPFVEPLDLSTLWNRQLPAQPSNLVASKAGWNPGLDDEAVVNTPPLFQWQSTSESAPNYLEVPPSLFHHPPWHRNAYMAYLSNQGTTDVSMTGMIDPQETVTYGDTHGSTYYWSEELHRQSLRNSDNIPSGSFVNSDDSHGQTYFVSPDQLWLGSEDSGNGLNWT